MAMNNQDFQRLLLTNDKALVNELTKAPKRKAGAAGGKQRERPKGKGKGKEGEGKGKNAGKGGEGKGGAVPSGGQAPAGPQYRDRAKERREQQGEYETVAQEFENHGEVSVDQSKYLGGDLQHTHLVKGLDFALLSKVRTELTKQKKVEEVQGQRAQKKAGVQKKRAFETQLGRRVWHSIIETLHPHHTSFRKRLQGMSKALAAGQRIRGAPGAFLPGRMSYEFDIGAGQGTSDIPRTVYTSKEDAPAVDRSRWVAAIMPETVQRVREVLMRAVEERRQRKRERAAGGGAGEVTYAVAQKVVTRHKAKDADNDIFSGAGSFDAAEVARSVKSASRAPSAASADAKGKQAPSYFADAGAEKYKRAPEGQIDPSELEVDEREGGAANDAAGGAGGEAAPCAFEAAERFLGPRVGWSFKLGPQGLGYYREAGRSSAAPSSGGSAAKAVAGAQKRRRGVPAPAPAPEDDAYGECFPDSGLGHAAVATGEGDSDEEGDDAKKKIERLKKLAGKKGEQGGPDSVAANKKGGDPKKKKMTEEQQWQKIDHMIKKGKHSSLEELEAHASMKGRKQPPAPREIMSTPAYF